MPFTKKQSKSLIRNPPKYVEWNSFKYTLNGDEYKVSSNSTYKLDKLFSPDRNPVDSFIEAFLLALYKQEINEIIEEE